MASSIRWQAFRLVKRSIEHGGPFEQAAGAPFTAADKGTASAIGRRLVGREFSSVRSCASIACDVQLRCDLPEEHWP